MLDAQAFADILALLDRVQTDGYDEAKRYVELCDMLAEAIQEGDDGPVVGSQNAAPPIRPAGDMSLADAMRSVADPAPPGMYA
jgi:hypothetical protein